MAQLELSEYILDHSLGTGATGKVKLGRNKTTGELVAVKIIKKGLFEEHPELLKKVQREVALMRLQQTLTQGSSGPAFFRSMLCSLQANDMVAAKRKMDEYLQTNPAWRRTTECTFLNDIIAKIEEQDIMGYDEAVQKYQTRMSVDKWVRDTLLDLRKYAEGGGNEGIL